MVSYLNMLPFYYDSMYQVDKRNTIFLAHKGMLLAASNIYKELVEKEVLRKIIEILDDPEYKDYKIVVTGHSLGAGTAAILGFFLNFFL